MLVVGWFGGVVKVGGCGVGVACLVKMMEDNLDEAMAGHVDGLGAVRQDVSTDFEDDDFSDLDAAQDAASDASTAASEAEG